MGNKCLIIITLEASARLLPDGAAGVAARKSAPDLEFVSSQIAPARKNPMLNVVLYQPEIPPNTGNIIRLCANTCCRLHLVGPLGFTLDDARMKRAGLDYHELACVSSYPDWSYYLEQNPGRSAWAFSTRGTRRYSDARFDAGDALVFGPETRGLPDTLLREVGGERVLRLPMVAGSRSLNLSNSVAVAVYEAMRQLEFEGLA
jgi:tRNA (cytidine/uridine-2'-O-)-methyltransferase